MRLVALLALLAAGLAVTPAADADAAGAPHPAPAPTRGARALSLAEVLRSVDAHYPLLSAVLQERAIAAGGKQEAEGGFDLKLRSGAVLQPEGYYENYTSDTLLEQPTTVWGTKLFAGYRLGRGRFPIYEGGRETETGGEFRAGLAVPLLRDGAIDERRADLRKAEIEVAAAEPKILTERIEFNRQATRAYWKWVAAGQLVGVARRLLETAQDRQTQLNGRVERGALPRIDLADNERLIVSRDVKVIEADLVERRAAIDLSLFLRDASGDPVIVSTDRLPAAFPPEERPDGRRLSDDVAVGLARNPVLQEIAFERARMDVDRRLAGNALLPRLDVEVRVSQDVGRATERVDLDPAQMQAFLGFEVPLQRREAKGKLAQIEAKLLQIDAERRFTSDKVTAAIKNAFVTLETAYAQLARAKENARLALELQAAEERKLELGTSNLIDVNIREVQAADAQAAVVDQAFSYFAALADYRAAIAADVGAADALALPES